MIPSPFSIFPATTLAYLLRTFRKMQFRSHQWREEIAIPLFVLPDLGRSCQHTVSSRMFVLHIPPCKFMLTVYFSPYVTGFKMNEIS